MPRPTLTQRQAILKSARETGTFEPAELPAKVTCERCGRDQWPGEDGHPRYHLRAARPGDEMFNADVPTMTACE
jgi:hypothetical protein